MMKFRSLALAVSFAAALFTSHVHAQGAGQLGSGQVWGNPNAAGGRAQATDIAAVLTRWGIALPVTVGGTGAGTASGARTNLGLAIGTNVEAWDNDLDCLAALSTTGVLHRTGTGTCSAAAVALTDLAAGTSDMVIGYFGSTVASTASIPNCTGALIYSTSTHLFTCNSSAGTGTVTEQKDTASVGIATSGNCDNTTTNAASPCDHHLTLANASVTASPTNPVAVGTTAAMMGLAKNGCNITPVYSGRVRFEISGGIFNGTSANGVTVSLRFGTGTSPINGATGSPGTALGAPETYGATAANSPVGFTAHGIATGLTPSTAYWFDLQMSAASGTVSGSGLTCEAMEY